MTAFTSLMSFPVALMALGSFWLSLYSVRGKTSVSGAPQAYVLLARIPSGLPIETGQHNIRLLDPQHSPSRTGYIQSQEVRSKRPGRLDPFACSRGSYCSEYWYFGLGGACDDNKSCARRFLLVMDVRVAASLWLEAFTSARNKLQCRTDLPSFISLQRS